jgi:hypothetical protein
MTAGIGPVRGTAAGRDIWGNAVVGASAPGANPVSGGVMAGGVAVSAVSPIVRIRQRCDAATARILALELLPASLAEGSSNGIRGSPSGCGAHARNKRGEEHSIPRLGLYHKSVVAVTRVGLSSHAFPNRSAATNTSAPPPTTWKIDVDQRDPKKRLRMAAMANNSTTTTM